MGGKSLAWLCVWTALCFVAGVLIAEAVTR